MLSYDDTKWTNQVTAAAGSLVLVLIPLLRKMCFFFSFQASIYLCLWPHSQPMRQFSQLFIFWAVILAPTSRMWQSWITQLFPQHLGARCPARWAVSSLLSPIHPFFPLHMHSFLLYNPPCFLAASFLLLSSFLWHQTIKISFQCHNKADNTYTISYIRVE